MTSTAPTQLHSYKAPEVINSYPDAPFPIMAPPDVQQLFAIVDSDRNSSSVVYMKSGFLRIRFTATTPPTTTLVLVLVDTQPDGSLPTAIDIFEDLAAPISPFIAAVKPRFVEIARNESDLDTYPTFFTLPYDIPTSLEQVSYQFINGSGNVAEVRTNNLLVVTYGEGTGAPMASHVDHLLFHIPTIPVPYPV